VLVAQGGDGAAAEQTWVLSIAGAHGPPEGTGGAGGGASSGAASGGAGGAGTDGDGAAAEDGCACRMAGDGGAAPGALAGWVAALALWWRRRATLRASR
jgi:MYXO-CTERM domain-containing protein